MTAAQCFTSRTVRDLAIEPGALDGLRRRRPEEAVSFEEAARIGGWGGDRKSAAFRQARADQGDNGTLKRGSNQAAYLTARLARDRARIAGVAGWGFPPLQTGWDPSRGKNPHSIDFSGSALSPARLS
jgi:hypothetical protein